MNFEPFKLTWVQVASAAFALGISAATIGTLMAQQADDKKNRTHEQQETSQSIKDLNLTMAKTNQLLADIRKDREFDRRDIELHSREIDLLKTHITAHSKILIKINGSDGV